VAKFAHLSLLIITAHAKLYVPPRKQILHIRVLGDVTRYTRVVQALKKFSVLPSAVRAQFHGTNGRAGDYVRRSLVNPTQRANSIDLGCLKHVEKLYSKQFNDSAQLGDLREVLENFGCEPDSSSVLIIEGLADTKNTFVRHLVGTLLCHSVVGYGREPQGESLEVGDRLCRRPGNSPASRILLCSQLEASVDALFNMLQKELWTEK